MKVKVESKSFIVSLNTKNDEEDLTFELSVTGTLHDTGDAFYDVECTTTDGCEFTLLHDKDLEGAFDEWTESFYEDLMGKNHDYEVLMGAIKHLNGPETNQKGSKMKNTVRKWSFVVRRYTNYAKRLWL